MELLSISYWLKLLSTAEICYNILHKENSAMVWIILIPRLVLGDPYFVAKTDRKALPWIVVLKKLRRMETSANKVRTWYRAPRSSVSSGGLHRVEVTTSTFCAKTIQHSCRPQNFSICFNFGSAAQSLQSLIFLWGEQRFFPYVYRNARRKINGRGCISIRSAFNRCNDSHLREEPLYGTTPTNIVVQVNVSEI